MQLFQNWKGWRWRLASCSDRSPAGSLRARLGPRHLAFGTARLKTFSGPLDGARRSPSPHRVPWDCFRKHSRALPALLGSEGAGGTKNSTWAGNQHLPEAPAARLIGGRWMAALGPQQDTGLRASPRETSGKDALLSLQVPREGAVSRWKAGSGRRQGNVRHFRS